MAPPSSHSHSHIHSQGSWRGNGRGGGRGRGNGRGNGRGRGRGRGGNYNRSSEQICSMTEPQVGITTFLQEAKGISGAVKQRYSDFLVNEIDLDGNIVYLQKLEDKKKRSVSIANLILEYFGEEKKDEFNEFSNFLKQKLFSLKKLNDKQGSSYILQHAFNLGLKQLKEIVDEKTVESFEEYYKRKDLVEIFLFPEMSDRELRTNVHLLFKKYMKSLFKTDTKVTEKGGSVRVLHSRSTLSSSRLRESGFDSRDSKKTWPSDQGKYLEFALYKENLDTVSVIQRLAAFMKVHSKHITFAGTKDKRAITTQLCRAFLVEKQQLVNVVKRINQVRVGNLCYKENPLRLGDLRGNHFSIVLRNVTATNEEIEISVKKWKENGFINYFGLQRFGSSSIATHEVGKELLKKNWSSAVDLILRPREGDDEEIAHARKTFAITNNLDEALHLFPPYLTAEVAVLKGLKNYGRTAYRQALDLIPYSLRLMYVHAYQSYIWNSAVSYRLQEMNKTEAVLGDLVVLEPKRTDENCLLVHDIEIEEQEVNEDDKQEEQQEPLKKKQKREKKRIRVKALTQEDLDSNTYTIFDVVLPIPGFDIVYPENQVKVVYDNIAEKHKIYLETLKKENISELFVPGAYRYMIKKPENLSWETKTYDDNKISLLSNDLDKLENRIPSESLPNGSMKALCLYFDLPSSSYATMALRELTKESSGLAQQIKLNQEFTTRIALPGSSLAKQ